jgi:hypothetical protein
MHLMSLLNAPLRTLSVWVRTVRSMSTWSFGSVLTKSTKVRAGTVVDPSSLIFAPIQQVIPSSRLVAERRSWPFSAAKSTFPRTGSVLRGATARETMLRPRAKFSCRQETFIRDKSLER